MVYQFFSYATYGLQPDKTHLTKLQELPQCQNKNQKCSPTCEHQPLPSGTAFSLSQTMVEVLCWLTSYAVPLKPCPEALTLPRKHSSSPCPFSNRTHSAEKLPLWQLFLQLWNYSTQSQWDLGAPSNKSVQEFLTVQFPEPLSWHRFSKPAKQLVLPSLHSTPRAKIMTEICDEEKNR